MEEGLPLKKPPGYANPTPTRPQQPAGPRKPVYYQPKKKSRSCCRICCCCICFLIVFLIILLAISCGLFYAWFQPKLPSFHFRPLELDRFNVKLKPDGTGSLDTKAIVRVDAKNPNAKLDIYYGETVVTLTLDGNIQFGSGTLDGFMQPVNNVTILKFELSQDNQFIDSSSGSRLKTRVTNEDAEVDAAVKTKVGIGIGKIVFGMLPVNVNCGGIKLKQLDQQDAPPKCSFNTLRWITIR